MTLDENHSMVITVRRGRWGRTRFSKPGHVRDPRYLVVNEGQTAIWVFWEDERRPDKKHHHRRPVHLEFQSNRVITAVGFGLSEEEAKQNKTSQEGCCGQGFRLLNNLIPHTKKAVIENPGNRQENGEPYHFEIWLKHHGDEKSTGIDPQIYNEGDLKIPGTGDPEKGGCLHVLRRLFTGWFR